MARRNQHRWAVLVLVIPGLILIFQNCSSGSFTSSLTQSLTSNPSNDGQATPEPEPSPAPDTPASASRDAFTTIKATSYDDESGSKVDGDHVGYLDENDYLSYQRVDFKDGARSASINLASPAPSQSRSIEVRLGSTGGPIAGVLTITNTGSWTEYQSQSFNLNQDVSGLHDVYLLMRGGQDVANIDSFIFSKQLMTSPQPPVTEPSPMPGINNSVQTILDDMTLTSTYPIAVLKNGTIQEADSNGYPSKYPQLIMGNLPHGSASPSWWKPPKGYEYLKTTSWNRIVPWIVVLTGTGNRATNTRIEFRNIKAYYKSKSSGQWIKIGEGPIDGYNCPPGLWDNCSGATDIVTTAQGTRSLKPAGTGSNFHGWGGSGNIANVFDVEIYYATLQARIVGGDTNSAQYMVHVGSDFYAPGISVNEMGGYNPGTGHSRSKGLTTSWQSISYATLNSAPKMQNPSLGVSPSVFTANPPPLD